jgi:serine/threonine-protein kinase HipA
MVINTFRIRFKLATGEIIKCGIADVIENKRKQVDSVEFAYHNDYLTQINHSIDPSALSLNSDAYKLDCDKSIPGFIDDILPDSWGKKVLSRIHNIPYPSTSDLLKVMEYSTVGALHFASEDSSDISFGLGCSITDLLELQLIAKKIDLGTITDKEIEQYKLAMFARGSSIGGARPKVLVYDDHKAYIAKFAKEDDKFDYATVEHACLKLMEMASLSVAQTFIQAVADENVLLVERFDVTPQKGRYHQITANALLKSPENQTDPYTASYNDIVKLISLHSCRPLEDKQQLFGQMLFNQALNNTDDHLRNFSFTCKQDGWQLSPAYDVVPSMTFGSYHQLKLGYNDILPSTDEAPRHYKSFGLTLHQGQTVIENVKGALYKWRLVFAECGVSPKDIENISKVIKI